jgi:hypothetical protein
MWLYKSPCRSCHVVTYLRQFVSCLSTVEVQGCLFHKSNDCSLSNTTWHLVLTWLARMSLGIYFLILLCQTNRQYLVWWTVSMTGSMQDRNWNSSSGCIKHEKSECSGHSNTLTLFSDFNVIYFLTNRTCQEWVWAWLFDHLSLSDQYRKYKIKKYAFLFMSYCC